MRLSDCPERNKPVEVRQLLKIADSVRSTHSSDGAVILDVQHGQMFTLNFVGSKILEMLRRGENESQIASQISELFQIRRDIVERDVREFIECLERNHLLQERCEFPEL